MAYLVFTPLHYPVAAHKFGILAAEFLTMIFWFAGFIAVAVLWTDIHCGSQGGACGAGTAATVSIGDHVFFGKVTDLDKDLPGKVENLNFMGEGDRSSTGSYGECHRPGAMAAWHRAH